MKHSTMNFEASLIKNDLTFSSLIDSKLFSDSKFPNKNEIIKMFLEG
jgi:hypothetical protein